jgi:hypothetical protein
MFALVESGSITKMLSSSRGITIDGVQHPRAIYTLWTEAERNAIGIYSVEMDNSKLKDEEWYHNTNVTYAFSGGKVTGSYGDATAKANADVLFTQDDEDNGLGTKDDVRVPGLKTIFIKQVKAETAQELQKTDWYVVRKADTDEAIPSAVATHRAAVRSKQADMETAITNASDTPALETLYTYTKQDNGSVTRPLGEIPIKNF